MTTAAEALAFWEQSPNAEMAVVITRKQHQRGRSTKFAWYWLYTVDYGRVLPSVGARTADFDRLDEARRAAKRNAKEGQPIVEDFA